MSELWNKSKGKIAVTAMVFLLGIPAVAGFLGLSIVDGPEGAVCFAEVTKEATPTE